MKKILSELSAIDSPQERAEGFEFVVKRILETAPEFRSNFKNVWLWNKYPDRRGADLGIDLVAENKQGERVAIQAKSYDPDKRLNWPDISGFHDDALGRAEIDQLMLITTTDKLSSTVKKQLEQGKKPCAIWARSDLENLGISPRTSLDTLASSLRPAATKFRPKRHQKTAATKAVAHLRVHKRGQVLMPSGTGKTLIGLWAREELNVKRTVVFVPSIALLRQTWSHWTKHSSKEFYSVAVCSESRGRDSLVSGPSGAGLPPTTDPDVIADALGVRGPIVVFATYDAAEVIEEAIKKTKWSFDLMIADDAHNTTSAGLPAFARPLDDENIPARRRLFLTATPKIVSKRSHKRGNEENHQVHSMNDTEVYGEIVYKLPFSEALEKNLVTDYEVLVVGVDDTAITKAIRSGKALKIAGSEIDAGELAAHTVIHRGMKKSGVRRLISFHKGVKHAKKFSKNIPIVREFLRKNRRRPAQVWGHAVWGDMPLAQREEILARLNTLDESECGIVSNAKCLGEAVDVPTIDGISFVQPKRNLIDIVQTVGRAVRKSKKKEGRSTIILPLPILNKRSPKATIESSAFEMIWRVLEGLRAHDDRLAKSLDALRMKLGQKKGKGSRIRLPKLTLDLPRSINAKFGNTLRLKVLESSTDDFWEGLGHLKIYRAKLGDCKVSYKFKTKDGYKLGIWVSNRRRDYKRGKLPQDRIDQLDALGFIWDLKNK